VIEKLFLFRAGIAYKGAVTPLVRIDTMRRRIFISALLIAVAAPFQAGMAQAQTSTAAAIEACMREVRSGLRAGQKLTEQQRMLAETQCRARAEQAQPVKK
jgi:hypothetical protein